MLRKLASRSAFVVAALAVVAAACNFKADFVLTKTFTHVTATSGAAYSGSTDVDLSTEAPGAWKRRDDLKTLDLVAVEAQVFANRGSAAVASGTVVLHRPSYGPDVTVGTWTNVSVPTGVSVDAPFIFDVTLSDSGGALIMDAIKGDGTFSVLAHATTATAIDLDMKVLLHIGINYHMGP